MDKLIVNYKYIWKIVIRWITTCFAVLGFVGMFISFESCFPENMIWIHKFEISIGNSMERDRYDG